MSDRTPQVSNTAARTPAESAPLAPEDAARLTDFARACKAAARAVMLYPDGHPAITATLARIAHVTAPDSLPVPLRVSVLANGLLLDGKAPARPDAAIAELAGLLHDHLIGDYLGIVLRKRDRSAPGGGRPVEERHILHGPGADGRPGVRP